MLLCYLTSKHLIMKLACAFDIRIITIAICVQMKVCSGITSSPN